MAALALVNVHRSHLLDTVRVDPKKEGGSVRIGRAATELPIDTRPVHASSAAPGLGVDVC